MTETAQSQDKGVGLVAIWIGTTRPKTLFAALAPVLMGGALAVPLGEVNPGIWGITLLLAVLVQIGTNFANDLFDHRQGADTEHRQGPRRGLQSGRISSRAMAGATFVCFGAVAVISAGLFAHAGTPVLVIAILSIFCGIFYTAGRFSLAYTGLADLFVVVFFGPVAVGATVFLQFPEAGWPPLHVLIAGLGPGMLATALLTVNNLRDADEDRESNKRTLAVRFGRRFSRLEYRVMVFGAFFVPLVAGILAENLWGAPWVWVLLPLAIPLTRKVETGTTGAELNPVLGKTGKLLLFYALLFSVTWPLGG